MLDAHAIKHSYTYRKRDGADPGKMLRSTSVHGSEETKREILKGSARLERVLAGSDESAQWSDFSNSCLLIIRMINRFLFSLKMHPISLIFSLLPFFNLFNHITEWMKNEKQVD